MSRDPGDMETNFTVRSFDAEIPLETFRTLERAPVHIILDNLRSAFNVGSIFRVCDTLRAASLNLCGYTASPPHKKLEKTSLGTIDYVPWKKYETTVEALAAFQARGIPVFAAETTSHSERYDRITYPAEVALVFGNEALGVSEDVLEKCDRLIEIPTYGFKNSLNVATAVSVIAFHYASTSSTLSPIQNTQDSAVQENTE